LLGVVLGLEDKICVLVLLVLGIAGCGLGLEFLFTSEGAVFLLE